MTYNEEYNIVRPPPKLISDLVLRGRRFLRCIFVLVVEAEMFAAGGERYILQYTLDFLC